MLDALAHLGAASVPFWSTVLIWTLVAGLAALLVTLLPRRFPVLQHDLRLALLVSLPGALTFGAISTLRTPSWVPSVLLPEIIVGREVAGAPAVDVFGSPAHLLLGLMSVVAIGLAIIGMIRLAADMGALRRVTARAIPVRDPEIKATFRSVLSELGLRRRVGLLESPNTPVPFVTGIAEPRIILPVDRSNDPAALRMIFLHECAHLTRKDHLTGPLSRLIRMVFLVHPLVGRLSDSLAFYREAACDHLVVSEAGESRRSYADLLFTISQGRYLEPIPALSIHAQPSQLKQRILAMSHSEPRILQRASRFLALVLLAGATVVSACSDPAATSSLDSEKEAPTARKADPGEDVFVVVEQMPELVGGLGELQSNIQYPELAKKAGVEGRVIVQFVVTETGAVQDATIVRGVGSGLDEAALAAVNAATFTPGMQRGEPVKVKMSVPITFRLQ